MHNKEKIGYRKKEIKKRWKKRQNLKRSKRNVYEDERIIKQGDELLEKQYGKKIKPRN